MKLAILLLAALVASCGLFYSGNQHPEHAFGYNLTSPPYQVAADRVSPKGLHFDPSGQAISGALLDRLTDEVGECLGKSIDRAAFVVKVPSDWGLSCDKTQQVLPATGAGSGGCVAKGLTPSEECPCKWRAYIQPPNVIVATPSLYLFKDALTRFETGSMNPWADPKLAKCVAPSTDPLSNGSGP